MTRCSKLNCRCSADRHELHGPDRQWAYSTADRRYTRRLTDVFLDLYEPEIERARD